MPNTNKRLSIKFMKMTNYIISSDQIWEEPVPVIHTEKTGQYNYPYVWSVEKKSGETKEKSELQNLHPSFRAPKTTTSFTAIALAEVN